MSANNFNKLIDMGRIDADIPEELETRFRIEVVKRLGGKKGDLQKAVEEALELWTSKSVLENLKRIATNPEIIPLDQEKAVKTIGDYGGYGAMVILSEIASEPDAYSSVRDLALEQINVVKASSRRIYFPR